MPKVIKSESVTEEKNPFLLDLPVLPVVPEQEAFVQFDDLDFFKDTDMVPEQEHEEEKYYQIDEINGGDEVDERYFVNLDVIDEQTDARGEEFKKYYDSSAKEQEEDIEIELATEDAQKGADSIASVEEAREKILVEAEQQAKKLINEAKKEAESLRMKLVAEISEAEVKKELAKSVVQNTIDDANYEADQIIENANKASTEIQEKAKNEGYTAGYATGTEDGYKQGLEKGFAEGQRTGYEKGHKEGFARGEEEGRAEGARKAYEEMGKQLSVASQKAKFVLIEAEKEKAKIVNSSDNQIIEIAMSVASKILNKEFSENPFAVLQIVKEAVQKVSDQPRIFITVSPANYDLINMTLGEIKKSLGNKQEISVVADSTFGNADVIVGTGGSGDVDARLETQLSEIRKTIEMVIGQ